MSDNQPFRDETGQVTGIRVLPATAEGANYEIALSTEGTIETTKYSAIWPGKLLWAVRASTDRPLRIKKQRLILN